MDEEKGLELSLRLACGGSSSNSKDRSSNSADARTDPDERTNKILNDFKTFLGAGSTRSFQRNDAIKPEENFFSNLQQTATGDNVSGDEPGVGDKRKIKFDERNSQKKQDTESLEEKDKISHISITTDEGSTADNEDVAESEAEGSTSRLASHHEDGSRTSDGSGSSSQTPKELGGKPITSIPFSVQSMSTLNVPYSITIKEAAPVSSPSTSNYPLSGIAQGIPSAKDERPRIQATALGSLPMSFGYSPVQLPVLDDKDSPWRMISQPQSLPSPYAGRSISTSVPMQVINPSSSESVRLHVHPLEQLKGQTQLVAEEGSSSQVEDDAKGRGNIFPSEYPGIRPGIATEMKFGGSGSFPNLPWVSTSQGPNGKTISGVTYKYNATQIKIVCACHGIHMSPEDFIRHATEEEHSPVTMPNLTSLQTTNPATSAKT